MRSRRRFARTLSVLSLIVLTSCSKPDTRPVPVTAEPPYACDGVPRSSAELLMGGSISVDQIGGWDGSTMACGIHAARGGESSLTVFWDSMRGHRGEEAYADRFGGFEGAEPIIASAPGSGHVKALDDGAIAWWVCEGTVVTVGPDLVDVKGRDLLADTRNLLVSILPWACDGQPVPLADDSP